MKDMSALLVFTLALSFAVSAIAEPVRIAVKPGESLAAARDAVRALPRDRYGDVVVRAVLYRGTDADLPSGIRYRNVNEYLKNVSSFYPQEQNDVR